MKISSGMFEFRVHFQLHFLLATYQDDKFLTDY